MKKTCLIIVLLNCISIAYPQFFKGTVLEESTNNKLSFVSVYFDGTTVGTTSDVNGYFELDISKSNNLPITVSALGYYSVTLNDYSATNTQIIYLTHKEYQINEVLITGKNMDKNRKSLKLFKSEFLGKTPNALECEILNENDILFSYDVGRDTLKAYSSKPIQIHNKALGYYLTYYLDKFEYCKTSKEITIRGNCIFRDDSLSLTDSIKKITDENRKQAYLGSRMHFFRSLWSAEITNSKRYSVQDSNNVKLEYGDLVIQKGDLLASQKGPDKRYKKYMRNKGKLYIWYPKKKQFSTIEVTKEVFFDKRGYYDPFDIVWYGDMAKQRLAEQVPYDYTIE